MVPNLTRLESTSIELTRGSKPNETRINEYRPNESRDLWTVIGLTDSYITHKGIYIACLPSTRKSRRFGSCEDMTIVLLHAKVSRF